MFIVTNRMVNEQGKTPSEIFGEKPAEGPNELRLAEARRQGKQWQLDLLPDQITAEMAASVGLDPDLPHPASAYCGAQAAGALRRDRQHGQAEAQDWQTPAAVRTRLQQRS